MSTGCRKSQEDLERVITNSFMISKAQIHLSVPTYINHWKPVKVPSITIRVGRPFQSPEKPMLP